MSQQPGTMERLENRFAQMPRFGQLVLAAVFWPLTIAYGVYYMWSREALTLPMRIVITIIAMLFVASVVLADLVPDRERPRDNTPAPSVQPAE